MRGEGPKGTAAQAAGPRGPHVKRRAASGNLKLAEAAQEEAALCGQVAKQAAYEDATCNSQHEDIDVR